MLSRVMTLFAVVSLLSATAVMAEPKRLALVIGNDTYENLPALSKAVNDATAIGRRLDALGFAVTLGVNQTRRDINRKLTDLEKAILPGDLVLFFFAGHGVALGADNVLLPTDMSAAEVGEENLVREEGVIVDTVLRRIRERGAATVVMVLDACRDNPFAAKGTRGIGQSKGLGRVEAPKGSFVLFSAGLGQTALDGLSAADPDPNSVFTRKLLPLLDEAGLTQVELAKRVQRDVDELAASVQHDQQPAYFDQVIGEVVLHVKAPEPPPAAPVPEPRAPALSEAGEAWIATRETNSIAVIEAFIARFGNTAYADLARARLAELKALQPSEPVAKVEPAPAVAAPSVPPAAVKPADVPAAEPATSTPPTEEVIGVIPPNTDGVRELVQAIQTELTRVGCLTGTADGVWGRRSASALAAFATATKANFEPTQPSEAALAAVKAAAAGACPAATTVSAPAAPVVVAPAAKKPVAVAKKPPRKPKAKTAARKKSGGTCFVFDGRTVCE
jgi:hypothetical protein